MIKQKKQKIEISLDVRYSEDPRIEPGLDELNGEVIGDSSPAKIRAAIASKKKIADAIRSKHGRITDVTPLADYAEEISAIEQGVVTRDDTVTAETMLEGVTAHNAAGEQITGNIKTVTASLKDNTVTVPAGYVASGQTLTVEEMAASLSGNTVTIPKGYNPAEKTLAVAEAEAPTVSENIVTVNPGYVASKQTVKVAEAGALSVIDNVVTVPIGYIKSQRTATVAVAVDPAVSDNKVTVNKGYMPEQKIITIAEAAEPTIAANVVTVYKGYVKSQKTVTIPEMTVQNNGEKVIIPVGYNKKAQEITISSGGIDTSDATATAAQMLNGVTAYVKGVKVTGNIPTVTATLSGNVATVPAGYIASEQTLTVPAVTATLSANTVTVPVGYIAEKQTLTIPAVTPTLADNVVTVPQGYIAEKQTLTVAEMAEPSLSGNVVTIGKGYNKAQKTVTVPEAGELSVTDNVVTVPVGYIKTARTATVAVATAPTTSGNVVTVNKGYQAAQKKITVGTSVAAKTYTPGTADQTIAAGSYLAGKQTIKGDANLIAENIAEGISIFNVAGTLKASSGSIDFYECASYTPDFAGGVQYSIVLSGASDENANGTYVRTKWVENPPEEWVDDPLAVWENENGYKLAEYYYSEFNYSILNSSGSSIYTSNEPYWSRVTDYSQILWADADTWEEVQLNFSEGPTTELPPTIESWSGYKVIQDSETGAWVKTDIFKENMKAPGYTPEVGRVYSEDTSIAVRAVYDASAPFLQALYHFDGDKVDATGKTSITGTGDGWYNRDSTVRFGTGSMEADCYMSESGYSSYYLEITGLPEMDAFTIEWWQYDHKAYGDGGFVLAQPETDDKPVSLLPALKISYEDKAYISGKYKHWAFVRNAGATIVRVYLNGKLAGTVEFADKLGGRKITFTGVSSYSGTQVKDANIDELAFYSAAKYTEDFTPSNDAIIM